MHDMIALLLHYLFWEAVALLQLVNLRYSKLTSKIEQQPATSTSSPAYKLEYAGFLVRLAAMDPVLCNAACGAWSTSKLGQAPRTIDETAYCKT